MQKAKKQICKSEIISETLDIASVMLYICNVIF